MIPDFRMDGAARFAQIEVGLNGMTVRRFRRLLDESGYAVEYCTALVRCRFLLATTALSPFAVRNH